MGSDSFFTFTTLGRLFRQPGRPDDSASLALAAARLGALAPPLATTVPVDLLEEREQRMALLRAGLCPRAPLTFDLQPPLDDVL